MFSPLTCFYKSLGIFSLALLLQTILDAKKGSWILGGGWNNDLWGGKLPMASWIDDVTSDNPVRRQ